MNKKFNKKKGTCQHCGKRNVTIIEANGEFYTEWLCWKCAEKVAGIKPKEHKFTQSIGDIMKANGIVLQ